MKLEVITNQDVCTDCGGKCCQAQPGAAYPEDFGRFRMEIKRNLTAALVTGYWCIDWWEGDAREGMRELSITEYIRPADILHVGEIRHASWGGQCSLWTAKYGCGLKPQERPRECRMLKPRPTPGDNCITHDGTDKQAAAIAWIPYHDLILQAEARAIEIREH